MGNYNIDDETDLEILEEKYLNGLPNKSSKQHHKSQPQPILNRRRSSSGNSTMENLVQASIEKTAEFLCKTTENKAKLVRERSSSSTEFDIDEELACLVKSMTIKTAAVASVHAQVPKNALYYGWFLGQTTSDSLYKLGYNYLKECLEIQQFKRWTDSFRTNIEKGLKDHTTIYETSIDSKLHITAKFCGRMECLPYSELVEQYVGTEFNLAIVGIFFTEKTFGFRVKLSNSQQELFDNDRDPVFHRRNSSLVEPPNSTIPLASSPEKGKVAEYHGGKSKSKAEPEQQKHVKAYPGIVFKPQKEDFIPTCNRAHVTLGCSPRIKPKQAGDDLLDIIDLEQRSSKPFHDYKISYGTLRQFGRQGDYVYVLYPKNRIMAKGVFLPML